MGKQKQPIVIIGEGPTEYYYFNSLKDKFRSIQIEPTMPKHTSMRELGKKIEECISNGYAKVLCVIDMVNKSTLIAHMKKESNFSVSARGYILSSRRTMGTLIRR